jgi:hypothetical protein
MQGNEMKLTRKWAMPNKNTFSIKPINELIKGVIIEKRAEKCLVGSLVIDPFANDSCIKDYLDCTNDLDESIDCTHHMDALDFLKQFDDESVDVVLFDPPYSPRQVSEVYKKLGRTVNMQTTQSSFWGNLKKEISRITKSDAIVISCGWNSGGIGVTNHFEIIEVLIIPHGGWHNDTIVTVEKKINY